MILDHVGISGCILELINSQTLRKTSPSVKYNNRLVKQMEKQELYSTNSITGTCTPKILSYGYTNDSLFYIDMQYVNGKLFTEEFERMSRASLNIYTDTLLFYFSNLENSSSDIYETIELKSVLLDKLSTLHSTSQYVDFISYITNYVNNLKELSLPKTNCHGDLTFSNILFTNNQLCFLDFLDSYIDSFVIDIVKLKQDLYYGWYLNFVPSNNITRIKQILRYIWRQLYFKYSHIINSEIFYILDAINFLRIEPYLQTDKQRLTLHKIIGETELYEKFNSSNDG